MLYISIEGTLTYKVKEYSNLERIVLLNLGKAARPDLLVLNYAAKTDLLCKETHSTTVRYSDE